MSIVQEQKFDTVEFGGALDTLKARIGKRLNRDKAEYVLRQSAQAEADQTAVMFSQSQDGKLPSRDEDPFNWGWLDSFSEGVYVAHTELHKGVWFFGSKASYLKRFVTDRKAFYFQEFLAVRSAQKAAGVGTDVEAGEREATEEEAVTLAYAEGAYEAYREWAFSIDTPGIVLTF